ncbi:MAG: chloride channel protein, partial [Myxococcales bacterium]|nr:chloride channel protein [Myxococcales bacterium]
GGSGGLEASVALVGESVAAGLFKPRAAIEAANEKLGRFSGLWRWWASTDPTSLQAAQLCGISAAIATLIGAPFAAAFFAVEVMYRRRPIIDRLIYALISALVAFFLTHLATGATPTFDLGGAPPPPLYEPRYYLALLVVTVTVAVVARAFREGSKRLDGLFSRVRTGYARHLLGALLTGVIAITAVLAIRSLGLTTPSQPLRLIIGTGESTIEAALQGQLSIGVAIIALAARVAATLTTITSGGSAGLLFPTLCFGTLVASIWAQVFDVAPATLIVPAMTGSLVSIVNVPLAAILLVIEGFGREYIVPSLFILVAASIVSHETSIYRTQRESFDQNEILPGFGVRRIPVPERWVGRDLRALAIRQRYGVTVIGMIDRTEEANGRVDSHVLLNPRADHDLTSGDVLIVLGETERVEAMEKQLIAIATAEVDGHPDDAPPSLRNAPFSDAEGPFSRSPESLDRALDTDDEA